MENWDDKFDYLKLTRSLYLNIDYLQFLIEKVWKITKKVDVIDFGCGYGYLGLVLMPLLPNGSSYTGVDISEKLINKGKEIFKDLPFNHKFILSSVNNVPEKDDTFDIAICNSVLMHIPEPDAVLAEMKRITKNDGMIITCESNWNAVNALLYIDGIKKSKITDLGFLQILFERIHEKTKRIISKIFRPASVTAFGLFSQMKKMKIRILFTPHYNLMVLERNLAMNKNQRK